MDEYEEETPPSYPWSWKWPVIHGGVLLANLCADAAKFFAGLTDDLAAAGNHDVDQRDFRSAVAQDIETIDQLEE